MLLSLSSIIFRSMERLQLPMLALSLTLLQWDVIVLFSPVSNSIPSIVAARTISLLSNCSYSYGLDFSGVEPHSKTPKSIFGFEPLLEPTLKSINFGFGTTGTNAIYYRDLRKYSSGCHWGHCSGSNWRNLLKDHFEIMRHCVVKPDRTVGGQCDSKLWLSQLQQLLPQLLSNGLQLLGDNPMNYVFSEVLALVPAVRVEHTLRNPVEWVLRRIDAHGGGDGDDLLCDPRKLPATTTTDAASIDAVNPFDVLRCVQQSAFVMDNLVFMKAFIGIDRNTAHKIFTGSSSASILSEEVQQRVRQVAHYYTLFNRHVLEHTKEDNYFPSCVWDSEQQQQLQQQQHHVQHKLKPKSRPARIMQ